MVKVIKITDIVKTTSYNKDGEVIFDLVRDSLMRKEQVSVSFEGIQALNTSFINSAFIELLEDFNFDEIKKYLTFTNSTRQINSIIAKRFKEEVESELLATV
ncbi:STAS-like domain-containing protein [Psychrobacillus sp. FSL K6-2365]|uniref:STAS-like domain-containing protein n=1 Tax=Psychrobacillus sp. FSL K6-2365 TaxID=2921546 RepID=UPI0030F8C717